MAFRKKRGTRGRKGRGRETRKQRRITGGEDVLPGINSTDINDNDLLTKRKEYSKLRDQKIKLEDEKNVLEQKYITYLRSKNVLYSVKEKLFKDFSDAQEKIKNINTEIYELETYFNTKKQSND
jgi:hypothetical protein